MSRDTQASESVRTGRNPLAGPNPATPSPDRSGRLVLHTRVIKGPGGGPDKTILNSPRFLEGEGYPMVCAFLRHPRDELFPQLERRARAAGVSLELIDDRGPLDWRVLRDCASVCRRRRPVIWHGHDYKSDLLGLILRRRFGLKLVTTAHGFAEKNPRTRIYYAINRLCFRHYDHVICVSEPLRQQCLSWGVPEAKCTLIPNAIDVEAYSRSRAPDEAKRALGIPPERIVVGSLGRLSEEKRFDLLIEATARLVREGADLEVRIAGEGVERPKLERLIAERGLQSRVKLLGFEPDPVRFLEALDIAVLCSSREGLPNALLEAMSLEIPFVATEVGAIPEVITDNENGILVPSDSVPRLSEAISALSTSVDQRHRLGRRARDTVVRRYSFRARMQRVKEVYDLVMLAESGENAPPASEGS